jgi:hypothetical protein
MKVIYIRQALGFFLMLFSHGASQMNNSLRNSFIQDRRNALSRPLLCRIIQESIIYSNQFGIWGEEEILCTPIVAEEEIDSSYKIVLPEYILDKTTQIKEGSLYVEVPGGVLSDDSVVGYSKEDIVIFNDTGHRQMQTSTSMGKRTVLVLRVSVGDSQPSSTSREFHDRIFGYNGVTLQSQYNKCSAGKLIFEPADVVIVDGMRGIMEVDLRERNIAEFQSSSALSNAAQAAAAKILGPNQHISSMADHVMICLPPGTGNWVASAAMNHWRSVYNDQYCGIIR